MFVRVNSWIVFEFSIVAASQPRKLKLVLYTPVSAVLLTSKLLQPDTATGVLLDQRHVAKILLFVKPIYEGIE